MTATNTEAAQLTSGQSNKYVTSNDADERISKFVSDLYTKSLTSVSTPLDASTGDEKTSFLEAVYIKFTGTLTGAFTYEVPSNKKLFIVENGTTGGFAITVKRNGQTGVEVAAGDKPILYNNGTDVVSIDTIQADETLPYAVANTRSDGAPESSEVMLDIITAIAFSLPSGLTGSVGDASVAATAETDFDIQKNGSSVGTMRFAAAGTTASFIMASETNFATGDKLKVIAPASADATLADIAFMLLGERS